METQVIETRGLGARRPYFSAIRWTAVFAGLVGGMATYLLLTLLGLAVGLTFVEPQAAEPLGAVPLGTAIWTGISMLIAAFVGGYVAGRTSGLFRLPDGMLHGFVSWASTTVLFAYLTTTALGAALGGTFSILSQTLQGAAQAGAGAGQQLEQIITGGGQIQVSPEALAALRDALSAGDRQGAIQVMVNQMGIGQEQARTMVDQLMPIFGGGVGEEAQAAAEQATQALTAASWWLFIGLLLSLGLAIWGGAMGVRAISNRTAGVHPERREEAEF